MVEKKITSINPLAKTSFILGTLANYIMFGSILLVDSVAFLHIPDDSFLSIIKLILEITSSLVPAGMGLSGLALGIVAIAQIKALRHHLRGLGIAIAGIAISCIPIAILLYIILMLFFWFPSP